MSFPHADNSPEAERLPGTGTSSGDQPHPPASRHPDVVPPPGGALPSESPAAGPLTQEWGLDSAETTLHPVEGILGSKIQQHGGTPAPGEAPPPPGSVAGEPGGGQYGGEGQYAANTQPVPQPRPPGPGTGPAGGGSASASERAPTGPAGVALAALSSLPKASTLVFDRELSYVLVAGRAPGHHGMSAEEIEGRSAQEVLGPDWWEIYGPLYRSAIDGDTRSLEIWSNDGTRCFLAEVGPLYDHDQEVVGGLAVFRDITKRKRSDEARHEAEERFELIFEQGPVGMALLTVEGRWARVNQALVEITGHTSEALVSKSLQELTYPDDRSNDIDELRDLLDGEISEYRVEKRLFHARGHVITVVLWVSLVRERSGRPQNLIAEVQDITERKLMEDRLHGLAEHDPLTDLCNRRLFEHELGLQVDRARRTGSGGRRAGEGAALLIVDLDNFRAVNESAGYRIGDELLKGIAGALQERLRGTDLIARLDGDEFGVLLRGTPLNAAEAVANGLRQVVADCGVEISGRQVSCTASIGLAVIDAETSGDDAVRLAAERDMCAEKHGKRRAEDDEAPGEPTEVPFD